MARVLLQADVEEEGGVSIRFINLPTDETRSHIFPTVSQPLTRLKGALLDPCGAVVTGPDCFRSGMHCAPTGKAKILLP